MAVGEEGKVGVVGNAFRFGDECGNQRDVVGVEIDGSSSGVAGSYWVEGTDIRYVEEGATPRAENGITGTLVGASTKPVGFSDVVDNEFHYVDENGDRRKITDVATYELRPTGTVSAGGWSAVGETSLHTATDEETANDDTDYAAVVLDDASNPSEDVFELHLSDPIPGVCGDASLVEVRVRGEADAPDLNEQQEWQVRLLEGATEIASGTFGTNTSWSTKTLALSAAERSSITDYPNLRVDVTGRRIDPGVNDKEFRVTWIEVQVDN